MNFNKFMGIAFMCHQRADRSFFYKGRQFPICARCTGIFAGYPAGAAIAIITDIAHYGWFLFLLLPMIVDGGAQQFLNIPSNNCRRFITGICGGIGIVYALISIHMLTLYWVTALLTALKWI